MGQTRLMASSPLTGTFNIYIYAVTFLSLVCVTVRIGKGSSCPCACHEINWESGGVAQVILKLVIKVSGQFHSLADCPWEKCFYPLNRGLGVSSASLDALEARTPVPLLGIGSRFFSCADWIIVNCTDRAIRRCFKGW
jgi:hypothetical protein